MSGADAGSPASRGKGPRIETVRDHIAWSYANLARAHAALGEGARRYKPHHHMVRAKLFKGLVTGTMRMGSLYDDERLKLTLPRSCAYCGSADKLTIDHLIARSQTGPDEADNLVPACRPCNSSKQGRDVLRWLLGRGDFPSLLVLRRYLKLVQARCETTGLLDHPVGTALELDLPFALDLLPHSFPPLDTLTLWVAPVEAST